MKRTRNVLVMILISGCSLYSLHGLSQPSYFNRFCFQRMEGMFTTICLLPKNENLFIRPLGIYGSWLTSDYSHGYLVRNSYPFDLDSAKIVSKNINHVTVKGEGQMPVGARLFRGDVVFGGLPRPHTAAANWKWSNDYYYDGKGNLTNATWVDIAPNDTVHQRVCNTYNENGQLVLSEMGITCSGNVSNLVSSRYKDVYDYDLQGKLVGSKMTSEDIFRNGLNSHEISSSYNYNESGQLTEIDSQGSENRARFKRHTRMVYDSRGNQVSRETMYLVREGQYENVFIETMSAVYKGFSLTHASMRISPRIVVGVNIARDSLALMLQNCSMDEVATLDVKGKCTTLFARGKLVAIKKRVGTQSWAYMEDDRCWYVDLKKTKHSIVWDDFFVTATSGSYKSREYKEFSALSTTIRHNSKGLPDTVHVAGIGETAVNLLSGRKASKRQRARLYRSSFMGLCNNALRYKRKYFFSEGGKNVSQLVLDYKFNR